MCTKHHANADPNYISIGNPGIIGVRDETPVKLNGYGNIGDYVPFYFTPRSIMQLNIVSGYWEPIVPKLHPENILVIQCIILELAKLDKYFFTNGQANTSITEHYNDLSSLDQIDWESIQTCNFSKTDGDFDRPRRYQAEFLVRDYVPLTSINALFVYNNKAFTFVESELKNANIDLKAHIQPGCFFS